MRARPGCAPLPHRQDRDRDDGGDHHHNDHYDHYDDGGGGDKGDVQDDEDEADEEQQVGHPPGQGGGVPGRFGRQVPGRGPPGSLRGA